MLLGPPDPPQTELDRFRFCTTEITDRNRNQTELRLGPKHLSTDCHDCHHLVLIQSVTDNLVLIVIGWYNLVLIVIRMVVQIWLIVINRMCSVTNNQY